MRDEGPRGDHRARSRSRGPHQFELDGGTDQQTARMPVVMTLTVVCHAVPAHRARLPAGRAVHGCRGRRGRFPGQVWQDARLRVRRRVPTVRRSPRGAEEACSRRGAGCCCSGSGIVSPEMQNPPDAGIKAGSGDQGEWVSDFDDLQRQAGRDAFDGVVADEHLLADGGAAARADQATTGNATVTTPEPTAITVPACGGGRGSVGGTARRGYAWLCTPASARPQASRLDLRQAHEPKRVTLPSWYSTNAPAR